VLQGGDHVYVFAQVKDKGLIQLMFGRPEAKYDNRSHISR
jgi:hypothetical protein